MQWQFPTPSSIGSTPSKSMSMSALRLNTSFGLMPDYEAITPTQGKQTSDGDGINDGEFSLFDAFMPGYGNGNGNMMNGSGHHSAGPALYHQQHVYPGQPQQQQPHSAPVVGQKSILPLSAVYNGYSGSNAPSHFVSTPMDTDLGFSSASDTASTGPGTPPSRNSPAVEIAQLQQSFQLPEGDMPLYDSDNGNNQHLQYGYQQMHNYPTPPYYASVSYLLDDLARSLDMLMPSDQTYPGLPVTALGAPNYTTQEAFIYGTDNGNILNHQPQSKLDTLAPPSSTTTTLPYEGFGGGSADMPYISSAASSPECTSSHYYYSSDESVHTTQSDLSNPASGKIRHGGTKKSNLLMIAGETTKEKRFLCSFPGCNRAFSRNFNLSTHYNTHLGIKPFACTHCTKTFSRRHDCARHIAAVHTGTGLGLGLAVQSPQQQQHHQKSCKCNCNCSMDQHRLRAAASADSLDFQAVESFFVKLEDA